MAAPSLGSGVPKAYMNVYDPFRTTQLPALKLAAAIKGGKLEISVTKLEGFHPAGGKQFASTIWGIRDDSDSLQVAVRWTTHDFRVEGPSEDIGHDTNAQPSQNRGVRMSGAKWDLDTGNEGRGPTTAASGTWSTPVPTKPKWQRELHFDVIAVYTDVIYGKEEDLPLVVGSFTGDLHPCDTIDKMKIQANLNDAMDGKAFALGAGVIPKWGSPDPTRNNTTGAVALGIVNQTKKILMDRTGYELVARNNGGSDTGFDIKRRGDEP
jgi:hypothetical protein